MAEIHLIISEVADPDTLAEFLAGEDNDTSPALEVEALIHSLGEPDAEFMEVEINGVREWL